MSGDQTFLNPYTFVPAFPRAGLPEPLRDAAPPGRDRLHEDRWTGRIGVTLTAETPLLLLDTTRATSPSTGDPGHQVYPVQGRDGRPHLSATSVKGMLRAAFEAVTNSRFGVFDGHDTPLGFRRDAGYALGMVPVYIAADGVLFRCQVASLKMYDKSGQSLHEPGEAPEHLARLRALIADDGRNGAKVVAFVPRDAPEKLTAGPGETLVEGIAYVTGPNIENKTSERLFFMEPGRKPEALPLAREWSALVADWNLLIQDYQRAHDHEQLHQRRTPDGHQAGPGERFGNGPGQLAWSPHIHDTARMELKPRTLCYVRCDEENRVDRLYPVLIPRDLYPVAPKDLLDPSLSPASCYDELSPADRVFGWVAPQGSGVRPSAYRGRLRIGPVTCEQNAEEAVERFDGDGLPLAILGRPKPQQGRFYLAESRHRPDVPVGDGTPKERLYQAGRGLRGRKAYWHQAGLDPRQHWTEGQGKVDPGQVRIGIHYREYRRSRSSPDDSGHLTPDGRRYQTTGNEQRDTQNRSIKGWVRPGTRFRFTVDVRDLDAYELGAITWLLSMPRGHYHRLGFGRPLGFGSIRLDIDADATDLHSGEQFSDYYRSLSAPLRDVDAMKILDQARDEFTRLVDSSDHLVSVRSAVLAVARGNPDLPVHYPRVRPRWLPENTQAPPDPRGRNYEWFTQNERVEKGKIIQGRGRSLPGLVDPAPPLAVYPDNGNAGNGASRRNGNGRKPSSNASRRRDAGKGRGNGGRQR
ncbi:TIGR03986 family CRISPR-associated RAMP protein [Sphaerisporangium sp. NPDC051011]|uniref:TIGR03986 family type III CRISPR-associated RAMP protein n=1 Tax=Sphaerisporangium sp. NPDC051011 TaxID=3155792 RepID=UPI0034045154